MNAAPAPHAGDAVRAHPAPVRIVDVLIVPMIMCGGAGNRLWPASRKSYPKPFMPMLAEASSFIETVIRVSDRAVFAPPVVIANEEHRFLIAEQLRQAGAADGAILLEPEGRDTAAAIAAGCEFTVRRDPNAVTLVLAADHVVRDAAGFVATCRRALPAAAAGRIVTFGVPPTGPVTAYGYIRPGDPDPEAQGVSAVSAFREKPDAATAQTYLREGYLWNSGNFMMRASVMLEELARHAPEVARPAAEAVDGLAADLDFQRLAAEPFLRAKKISIDYAVMEKTARASVVRAAFDWSDIGSWNALWEMSARDGDGNALSGQVVAVDVADSYVRAPGRLTALVGVRDLVVVVTEDAVLVADRRRSEDVKKLVDELNRRKSPLVANHARMYRPWGYYQTLDLSDRHQVKRIVVKPGAKLSLQKHHHRSEHWVVVKGTAIVTVDAERRMLKENESVYIPLGAVHRMENPGIIPLELIEVQSGSYLGEDDIVRIEDVYNRAPN